MGVCIHSRSPPPRKKLRGTLPLPARAFFFSNAFVHKLAYSLCVLISGTPGKTVTFLSNLVLVGLPRMENVGENRRVLSMYRLRAPLPE